MYIFLKGKTAFVSRIETQLHPELEVNFKRQIVLKEKKTKQVETHVTTFSFKVPIWYVCVGKDAFKNNPL